MKNAPQIQSVKQFDPAWATIHDVFCGELGHDISTALIFKEPGKLNIGIGFKGVQPGDEKLGGLKVGVQGYLKEASDRKWEVEDVFCMEELLAILDWRTLASERVMGSGILKLGKNLLL